MTIQRRQEFKPPEGDLELLEAAMSGRPTVIQGGRTGERGVEAPTPEAKLKPKKSPRHTYNVSDEVHQKAVNAVDFLSGPPHREQLGKFVERAIEREVARAAAEHNGGEAFPPADGPLRTGKRPGG